MVQDFGNGSADICLVMQAVGQTGHSLNVYTKISTEQTKSWEFGGLE